MNNSCWFEVTSDFPRQLQEEPVPIMRGARRKLGLPESGPLTTIQVLGTLRAFGYDISPAWIFQRIRDGKFPQPDSFGTELAWHNGAVIALMMLAHNERRWLPSFHRYAKSKRERKEDDRLLEQSRQQVGYFRSLETDELELRLDQTHDALTRSLIQRILNDRIAEPAEASE